MRFLILSMNTGGGHNTAANAVKQALIERGEEATVFDGLGVISPMRSKFVCSVYLSIVKHAPHLFGWIYRLSYHITSPKRKSVVYVVNAQNTSRLADFINSCAPDCVLTTHIFGAQQLTYLKRNGKIHCLTGGVITDYDVQPFWDETELDAYFTPHALINEGYARYGIPRENLFVTGIPVTPGIDARPSIADAKREAGYDPARKHALIAGGSMGAGKLPGTVDALLAGLDESVQLTVVCGNNKKLIRSFQKLGLPESRLRVTGFVNPLYALMRTADVLITKPGGLSSTEAFVQCVPMVAVHPIEGVERNNSNFMKKHGLALCPETDAEAVHMTRKLLNDEAAASAMRACQRAVIVPDACRRIADYVIALVRARSASGESKGESQMDASK